MGSLALLLLAASIAQAPAAGEAYPLVEVLDEARKACGAGGLPDVVDQPEFGGWTRIAPETASWLADYVAGNSEGGGGLQVTSLTFARTVAGRPLVAFVARLRLSFAPGAESFSCEVFDPDAPSVTVKALSAWARRSPKRSSTAGSAFFFARWEPGLGHGIAETMITSMPPVGTPAPATARPGLRYSAITTRGRGSE